LTQIVFDGGAQLGGFLRCLQRSSALVDSLRADARRNRERLLEVAAAAFGAADGSQVSLEAIARDAGVGIGTLYRHFPSRDLLVEAVYRAELAEVAAAAGQLLARYPPKAALRRWMDRYASFVAAKRGMADSLRTMVESGAVQINQMHARIVAAVDLLLQAGAADGTLRSDVAADDVVSSLIGIFITSRSPDQTGRMLDLLVAGVATPGSR
jgi:AcrR family transcriptional regulator